MKQNALKILSTEEGKIKLILDVHKLLQHNAPGPSTSIVPFIIDQVQNQKSVVIN